nr:unnamed protein product [Ipomoea batatas]
MEAGFLPDCVANLTQISPLEGASDAFVHREGGDSRSRQLPREKLVRRNPIIAVLLVKVVVVVTVAPAILPVLVLQNLRPVGDVHRQGRRHALALPAAAGIYGGKASFLDPSLGTIDRVCHLPVFFARLLLRTLLQDLLPLEGAFRRPSCTEKEAILAVAQLPREKLVRSETLSSRIFDAVGDVFTGIGRRHAPRSSAAGLFPRRPRPLRQTSFRLLRRGGPLRAPTRRLVEHRTPESTGRPPAAGACACTPPENR